jgi:acyl-CoA thioesterase FadM
VRKVQMRFRASARYEDELVVQTSVARLGARRSSSATSVRDARTGALLADGSTELACMDQRGGERKVALLPDDLRRCSEPFVAG